MSYNLWCHRDTSYQYGLHFLIFLSFIIWEQHVLWTHHVVFAEVLVLLSSNRWREIMSNESVRFLPVWTKFYSVPNITFFVTEKVVLLPPLGVDITPRSCLWTCSSSDSLSAVLETLIFPSTPTTTSTSKLSPSPRPVITSANQATWPRLTPLPIPTPLHPAEQRWGGLLQTASAPPAAPTRAAASGTSRGQTSTRGGGVQRWNAWEWTAGWHKHTGHVTTRHQGNTGRTLICKQDVYFIVVFSYFSLSCFYLK